MTLYLIIFCVLWGIFLISAKTGSKVIRLEYLALAIFVVLAGQRFETGNDWLIYRDHYLSLQQFGFSGPRNNPEIPPFEPLYEGAAWFFGNFFDFQNFMLIVAAFNGIVLFKFVKAWGASFAGVFAIYYSWVYLATQMATMRYSLALSFLLLGLMCVFRDKRRLAYLLVLVAAGFQSFSLAFLPIFYLIGKPLTLRRAFFLLIGGFVCVHVVLRAASFGAVTWSPFLEKLVIYLNSAVVNKISFGSLGYVVLNLIFFVCAMLYFDDDVKSSLVKWSVLYLLFFQIVVWMLPVFWNRVQVFTLVIQACVLSKYMVDRRRIMPVLAGVSVSLAVLLRTLSDPALISYVPYQSYWVNKILLGDARNDGEERFYDAIELNKTRRTR